ncbi:MAG: AMP-binding protein, partial [Acidobacteria bacterium]|nr:AMP-binding protein [Acidobacteriota bacterium]
NVLANIDQMERHPGGLGNVPPVVLGVLPFSHIYGLTMVLAFTLSASGTIVLMERFDASAALAAIESEAVTVVAGAPAMWTAFASMPDAHSGALSSVQFAVSGAAPLAVQTHDAVLKRFSIDIREGYGLTEASPAVTSAVGTTAPPGSVGRPLPGVEVRLVEPSGSDALIGDEGELWVRGPNVFAGYVGADDTSTTAIDEQGWLHTGDIAVVDDEGNLYLVDRAKDLIIVSGFNVHPAEVENALRTHPAIADAGVVGAADPQSGETVHAAVVVEPGASIEVDQIIEHCAAHLARYKCPTAIEFVDVIPRADSGKVLRRVLRRSR